MEQVRINPRTRASSNPNDPNEWSITEDGFRFGKGDRVFNYYDGVWVTVIGDPTEEEWFYAVNDEGRQYLLNSVRVSSKEPRR